MKLTDIQVRLLSMIQKRNELVAERDALLAEHLDDARNAAAYWRVVGELDGLNQGIHAFDGIEPIASLEYLAVKPAASASKIPLENWKI